jgi:NitT/TauT family transport system ATP-binding protein
MEAVGLRRGQTLEVPVTEQGLQQVPVEIENVSKVYETRGEPILALDSCSLELGGGEFVSVVGPSGCGKSTLMLMVAGLLSSSSGSIRIGGKEVRGPHTDLGIVFQEPVLLDWRKVMGNVLLQVELRRGLSKRDYRQRALDLLELVGLEGFEDRYPYELSGGMRQRVSICRALLHDPPLLLMDEPFGALDALTRDQLNLDLQSIWLRSRKTVMFVTHSISEAVFLSDRVAVFSNRPGKVVEILEIDLPRPRHLSIRETPEFGRYAAEIRRVFASLGILRDEVDTPGAAANVG